MSGSKENGKSELGAMVAAVAEMLAEMLAGKLAGASGNAPAPRFVEEGALARARGVERRALVAARKRGELTAHIVGRRVLLDVAQVDQWIASRATKASASTANDTDTDPLSRALATGAVRRLRAAGGR